MCLKKSKEARTDKHTREKGEKIREVRENRGRNVWGVTVWILALL